MIKTLQNHHVFGVLRHFISSRSLMTVSIAAELLGLSRKEGFSSKELKVAYFQRAKECHPDSTRDKYPSSHDASKRFIHLTDAYEFLLEHVRLDGGKDPDELTSISTTAEEEDYRIACMATLGLTAEVVEESKRCPLFRQWLRGRSDSAAYWNSFLMLHGGLAPRLQIRKSISYSSDAISADSSSLARRRRRDR